MVGGAVAAFAAGVACGWLLFGGATRSLEGSGSPASHERVGAAGVRRSAPDEPAEPEGSDETVATGRGARARDAGVTRAQAVSGEAPPAEVTSDRLARRLAASEADRLELLGAPQGAPEHVPERHGRGALTSSFRAALAREGIGGDVEGVDCAEYPCIVFGRLEGDEEDVEELERSDALDAYREDVLSLLLWAVSTEDAEGAAETALFAIAFYPPEERHRRGDALERRIRARVMEVWNTERPGPPQRIR